MTHISTDASDTHPLPSPKERRRLREARSLSEEQVATAVGVTRATVRSWETGRATPRGREREAYARLIGGRTVPQDATVRTRAESPTPDKEPEAPSGREARPEPPAPGARPSGPMTPTKPGPRPPTPVEATGSTTMAPTEPGTDPEPSDAPKASGTSSASGTSGTSSTSGTSNAPLTSVTPGASGSSGAGKESADRATAVAVAEPDAAEAHANPDTTDTTNTTDTTELPTVPQAAGEAFDALYRSCAATLVRQMFLLTGRRNLSQEAVARAFALAWERWPEVAVDADPPGWVRAAAYEYALSPWHRLRRAHRTFDPPPAEPGARALLDALLDLPPSYRRTLLLHDGVGLGLPETAAETEASTPATASRLMNARAAVAEQLPELAEQPSPTAQSELLHQQLDALARAQPPTSLPAPDLVRTGSEHRARLWTGATLAFAVLLIGLTLFTLVTTPSRYETPESPAQEVVGVPPRGGPQQLTPQDRTLQKKLQGELVPGPGRLVPDAG